MNSTASPIPRRQLHSRTVAVRIATALFVAEIVIALGLITAVVIVGAAASAGLDLLVPQPGPMPAPDVAPPGLGL